MWTATIRTYVIMLVAAALLLLPQGTFANSELSWVGRIEARPAGGAVGTWTVRGHSFSVTSATQIKEELGSLSVGACAR